MKAPVTLSVTELSDTTIESLALQIAEQQKKEVGTTYGYCTEPGCGFALSKATMWRLKNRGGEPRCRVHCNKRSHKDDTIYLCAVCRRIIIEKDRVNAARDAAKKGHSVSCGEEVCRLHIYSEMRSGSKRKNSSSKYRGVTYHRKGWEVTFKYEGRMIYAGHFATELEAAQAYDIAACDILGKNAKLNFGEPGYV